MPLTNDNETTLAQLKNVMSAFVAERDWEQFHTPKDLAIGLSIEASEVLEHFRFRSEAEVDALLAHDHVVEAVFGSAGERWLIVVAIDGVRATSIGVGGDVADKTRTSPEQGIGNQVRGRSDDHI